MMVHYISPYSDDKNIGKAYNEACARIPDNDWICIFDQDVLFLLPDTRRRINEITARGEYDLYLPVMNRLGFPYQLHRQKRSESHEIMEHRGIAKTRWNVFTHKVEPYNQITAGAVMVFRKSTWANNKFATGKYNQVHFDAHFGEVLRNKGGKVGLMLGIYVYHMYRPDCKDPQPDITHLV